MSGAPDLASLLRSGQIAFHCPPVQLRTASWQPHSRRERSHRRTHPELAAAKARLGKVLDAVARLKQENANLDSDLSSGTSQVQP